MREVALRAELLGLRQQLAGLLAELEVDPKEEPESQEVQVTFQQVAPAVRYVGTEPWEQNDPV